MVPCCDCATCEIGTDAFADDSQWTLTGTAAVSGGALVMNADGDQAIFTPEPFTDDDGVHIEVTADSTANGVLRVIANRVDNNNYVFGEYSSADSTIRIGKRSGGTDSYETPAKTLTSPSEPAILRLCWQPGESQTPASTDTEAVFPTTGRQGDSADTEWANPENITADDGYGNFALCQMLNFGDSSRFLIAENFPLAIPPNATIDNISVRVELQDNQAAGGTPVQISDAVVQITDGTGTVLSDNKATLGAIPDYNDGNGGPMLYDGSVTGYWGLTDGLTGADVNSPFWRVQLQYSWDISDEGMGDAIVLVGSVNVVVSYTTADRQPGAVKFLYLANGGTDPDDNQCVIDSNVNPASDGTGTGLRVASGDWSLDDWTLSYLNSDARPDCPQCSCSGTSVCTVCDSNVSPLVMQVDLSGSAQGVGECDCAEFDGTYLLDLIEDVGSNFCYYQYSGTACSGTALVSVELELYLDNAGDYRGTIWFMRLSAPNPQRFSINFGATAPDCTAFSAESFTHDFGAVDIGFACDFSGMSATLTSV